MLQKTIYHSNPPWGDIEDGIYIDSKKRQWKCTLYIGKWSRPFSKDFQAEVEMIYKQERKIVTTGEFRTYVNNQMLIKFK